MSGIDSRAEEAQRTLKFQFHDLSAMTLALALGRRGLGQCWPNPSVGVVISDGQTGRIISCAWTGRGGRPHAEAIALTAAGAATRGATVYTTLEPCSHWGKTPPCADALVAAGIKRLVYGIVDPDPRVAGQGLARLRGQGVEIAEGPLPREARWLALGHTLRVTAGRPFVQLKLAIDAEGMVPAGDGAPQWVTGPDARGFGHLLRAEADAIVIGSGTLAADNPELTSRLPGLAARSPVRIVFSTEGRLPASAKMLRNPDVPIWVISSTHAPAENRYVLERSGAVPLPVEADDNGRPEVHAALRSLAERGITRLLVEGGPRLAAALLNADSIDEAFIFRGAAAADGPVIRPFGTAGIQALTGHDGLHLYAERQIGADRLSIYRRREFW